MSQPVAELKPARCMSTQDWLEVVQRARQRSWREGHNDALESVRWTRHALIQTAGFLLGTVLGALVGMTLTFWLMIWSTRT